MGDFLPKGGGYRKLRVFAVVQDIYDLSIYFAKKFIRMGSRTRDQMEQAARSGKQNIAEGSAASVTSKETEIRLTNVAKSSLEELLLDYEDYIREHKLTQWPKDYERTIRLREYTKSEQFRKAPLQYADKLNAEEYCNLCVTLINQATYMLRNLVAKQEKQFVEEGGIKERMYKARIEERQRQASAPRQSCPICPHCQAPNTCPHRPKQ